MAILPRAVDWARPDLGLPPFRTGKVRDTFELPGGELLVVTSDRASIFDFVLPVLVPDKGCILNTLNVFWMRMLECEYGIRTHLLACGSEIDAHLPRELRDQEDLWQRAVVVRCLKMVPVEFVARGCLTGSGIRAYQKFETVYGHLVGEGLRDGDELPFVLDTPTTKAESGHDEPTDFREVRSRYLQETLLLLQVYQILRAAALRRGIVLADTKLEFGRDSEGKVFLADEVGTPDSSRYWDLEEWREGRSRDERTAPRSLDKEVLRAWGRKVGVAKRDPSNPRDIEWVHNLDVPEEIVEGVASVYRDIFHRITGMTVDEFWDA